MDDGFYTITYVGVIGMGIAVFLVENGKLRGFDMRGGKYDGTYVRHADGSVDAKAALLVPAGFDLLSGLPPPDKDTLVPLTAHLPNNVSDGALVMITVADRQVEASFKYMRAV